MTKIKIMLLFVILGITFNYQTSATELFDKIRVNKTEKILTFICEQASLDRPIILEKNLDNYLNAIVKILSNKQVLNIITKSLVEDTHQSKTSLSYPEKEILLCLCLYQYSQNNTLYRSIINYSFGTPPEANIFFDSEQDLYKDDIQSGYEGYKIYQTASNKILFVQLVGRGAHNNSYLVWRVEIKNNKFEATLLAFPDSKNKLIYELTGVMVYHQKQYLIVSSNDGAINYPLVYNTTYNIKNNKANLISETKHHRF